MAYCTVPYLKKKHNYDAAAQLLTDLVKVGDKKKNYSKLANALRTLAFCQLDDNLRRSLLDCVAYKDGSVQRLAYYFLGYPAPSQASYLAATDVLKAEQAEKQSLAKKVCSLRTLSHVIPPDESDATRFIIELATEALKEFAGGDKKSKKKDTEMLAQRKAMRYACLIALRQRFSANGDLLTPIINSLEFCDDPITARHSVAVLLEYAKDPAHSLVVADSLRRHLPQFDQPGAASAPVLAEDTFARVYMVRIYAYFSTTSKLITKSLSDEFYQALCHYASDVNIKVCFEAISCLAKLSWQRLCKEELRPFREGITHLYMERNPTVLYNLRKRITSSLVSTGPQAVPTINAATRVATALAKTYITSNAAKEDSVHPLQALFDPFQLLLKTASPQLRLKVLKLFIWLIHPREGHELQKILLLEWTADRLTPAMCNELMSELHERVVATPNTVQMVLNLIYVFATLRPEHVKICLLVRIFLTMVEAPGAENRSLVQKRVFAILDHHHTPETRETTLRLHRDLFWFLGETGHILADRGEGDNGMSNPFLKSILLRLEQAAVFGSWETRSVAIDALSKIALRSSNEVREHVVAFLSAEGVGEWVSTTDNLKEILQKTIKLSEAGDAKGLDELAKDAKLFCELPAGLA